MKFNLFMLLAIFPELLFAESIASTIVINKGISSYTVEKPEDQLKAQLDFPFEFASYQQIYSRPLSNRIKLEAKASVLINSASSTGKDYDWYKNKLSVSSSSNNKVDKYYELAFRLGKKLNCSTTLYTAIAYQQLDFKWRDTSGYDHIKNKSFYRRGETLTYQQDFYKLQLGLNYSKPIGSFKLSLEPSLVYAEINSKDHHLLRSFYTTQNIETWGYHLNLKLEKDISKKERLSLYIATEAYKKSNIKMNYYNHNNKNYLSLDSNYDYRNRQVGISYLYDF